MFSCVVFSNKLWSSSIGKSEVTLGVTRDWLCFIALFSIKSLSAFMSYQGQMIMLVETTGVVHLHLHNVRLPGLGVECSHNISAVIAKR